MTRRRPASSVGRRGERVAARALRRCGYSIVAKNLHVAVGEADIVCIAPDRRTLVIVEVKTRVGRQGERERRPESQVGARKQAKLRRVAEAVRRSMRATDRPIRIDVIAVTLTKRHWPRPPRARVRHIERAVGWSERRR
ncbi:MAG: YraN family protein [Planctomycetota bacterium]